MKNLSILVFTTLVLNFSNCCCQNISHYKEQARTLNSFYKSSKTCSQDSIIVYQTQFFSYFPSTFLDLQKLYGYFEDDSVRFGYLYELSFHHIYGYWKNLTDVIDKDEYYDKMIAISINGEWQSDGVEIFQQVLHEKAESDPELLCKRLQRLTLSQISSFWCFYFDGPVPPDNPPNELQKIKNIHPCIYYLMIEALQEIDQKWN